MFLYPKTGMSFLAPSRSDPRYPSLPFRFPRSCKSPSRILFWPLSSRSFEQKRHFLLLRLVVFHLPTPPPLRPPYTPLLPGSPSQDKHTWLATSTFRLPRFFWLVVLLYRPTVVVFFPFPFSALKTAGFSITPKKFFPLRVPILFLPKWTFLALIFFGYMSSPPPAPFWV